MKRIGVTTAAILAALCLGAAPALAQFGPMGGPPSPPAGTQTQSAPASDKPVAKEASPFSLPSGQKSQSAPAASDQKSPFALPGKQGGQAQAPAASGEKSPFSLPGKSGQGQPAGGSDKRSFALPSAQPKKGGPSAQELMDRGVALAREGKLKQAQDAFWQAVQTEPTNAVAWNNLGLTLRQQGKLNQAVGAYKRAIEADKNYAVPYKNLGVLLEKAGENALAAKAYRRYAKLAPDATDAATVNKRAAWLEARGNKTK
ncbi:MAG: tetratricopeptide repeat protein [Desulfarculaceae bacterium]|nr:tetratricopeptide repeat protein [Desulfarculaceae bacterium]